MATGLSRLGQGGIPSHWQAFRHERLPGPCLDGFQVIWQYEWCKVMGHHDGGFQVIWQYEWCKRTWVDFPPEQNEATEHAFQNDLPGGSVLGDGDGKDGRVPIVLDISSMA